jgi:hypothetical protein
VITYQVEPDFAVGQVVLHDGPVMVAAAVAVPPEPSLVAIVALVDAAVRRFTLAHAGTSAVPDAVAGGGAGVAAGRTGAAGATGAAGSVGTAAGAAAPSTAGAAVGAGADVVPPGGAFRTPVAA